MQAICVKKFPWKQNKIPCLTLFVLLWIHHARFFLIIISLFVTTISTFFFSSFPFDLIYSHELRLTHIYGCICAQAHWQTRSYSIWNDNFHSAGTLHTLSRQLERRTFSKNKNILLNDNNNNKTELHWQRNPVWFFENQLRDSSLSFLPDIDNSKVDDIGKSRTWTTDDHHLLHFFILFFFVLLFNVYCISFTHLFIVCYLYIGILTMFYYIQYCLSVLW